MHTYNSAGPRRAVVVDFIVDPGLDLSAGGEEVGVGYVSTHQTCLIRIYSNALHIYGRMMQYKCGRMHLACTGGRLAKGQSFSGSGALPTASEISGAPGRLQAGPDIMQIQLE